MIGIVDCWAKITMMEIWEVEDMMCDFLVACLVVDVILLILEEGRLFGLGVMRRC